MLRKFSRLILGLLLFSLTAGCSEQPSNDFMEQKFKLLEDIRDDRKNTISDFLHKLKTKTEIARDDPVLLEIFSSNRNKRQISNEKTLSIDSHFVKNYGDFYDILFINNDGLIFHTIKQESDYKKIYFKANYQKLNYPAH